MSKTINLSYKDEKYTLEFSRETVKYLERNGFVIADVSTKPLSTIPVLFEGAFRKNHKKIKRNVIDEIYRAIPNKDDLLGKLVEMYHYPIETLFDEEETEEGKVDWEASF